MRSIAPAPFGPTPPAQSFCPIRLRQRLDVALQAGPSAAPLARRRGLIYRHLRGQLLSSAPPPAGAVPAFGAAKTTAGAERCSAGAAAGLRGRQPASTAADAGVFVGLAQVPTGDLTLLPRVSASGQDPSPQPQQPGLGPVALLAAWLALGVVVLCAAAAHAGAALACSWTRLRSACEAGERNVNDGDCGRSDDGSFASARSTLSSAASFHSCELPDPAWSAAAGAALQQLAAAGARQQPSMELGEAIETLVAAYSQADAAGQAALAARLGDAISPADAAVAMRQARVQLWAALTLGGGRPADRRMLRSLTLRREQAALMPAAWLKGGSIPALARLAGLEAPMTYACRPPPAHLQAGASGWQRSLDKVVLLAAALGQPSTQELAATWDFAYSADALAAHGELQLLRDLVSCGQVRATPAQLDEAKAALVARLTLSIKLSLLTGDCHGWQLDLAQLVAAEPAGAVTDDLVRLIAEHQQPSAAQRHALGCSLFGRLTWRLVAHQLGEQQSGS